MLGNAVYRFFLNRKAQVSTTEYRWPETLFKNAVLDFEGEFIINCVGAIPQKTNSSFSINFELPIWLENKAKCNVIHAGTDCEMDEDEYGKSKLKGSKYIKQYGKKTKIIKTSIIGHEIKTSKSLLEWFLNSEKLVKGYTNAFWNGNTTLEWAKFSLQLIQAWDKYKIETILMTECISKHRLLNIIARVYNKKITIEKDTSVKIDKCLVGGIKRRSIELQLQDLKEFYLGFVGKN